MSKSTSECVREYSSLSPPLLPLRVLKVLCGKLLHFLRDGYFSIRVQEWVRSTRLRKIEASLRILQTVLKWYFWHQAVVYKSVIKSVFYTQHWRFFEIKLIFELFFSWENQQNAASIWSSQLRAQSFKDIRANQWFLQLKISFQNVLNLEDENNQEKKPNFQKNTILKCYFCSKNHWQKCISFTTCSWRLYLGLSGCGIGIISGFGEANPQRHYPLTITSLSAEGPQGP